MDTGSASAASSANEELVDISSNEPVDVLGRPGGGT